MDQLGQQEHWALYAASHVLLPATGELLVGPTAMTQLPLPEPIHVITAHNPAGRRQPDEHNERATRMLRARLADLAIDVLPADGCSPDGVWVEAGFATAGLTREQARGLAVDYAQDAIFEITATEVLIIATDTGAIVHRGSRRFE